MLSSESKSIQIGAFLPSNRNFYISKPIKIVELYGNFRISLRIFYQDGQLDVFGDLLRFQGSLNLEKDKIIRIDYCAKGSLSYLCLRTAKGNVIKAGEPQLDIEKLDFNPETQEIMGYYGSYNHFVSGFGVKLKDLGGSLNFVKIEDLNVPKKEEKKDMKKIEHIKNEDFSYGKYDSMEIEVKEEKLLLEDEKDQENRNTKDLEKYNINFSYGKYDSMEIEAKAENISMKNEKNDEIEIKEEESDAKVLEIENFKNEKEDSQSEEIDEMRNEYDEKKSEPKNDEKFFSKTQEIMTCLENCKIKVFLILSSEFCLITAKLLNFLRDFCKGRIIVLPNEKFPSSELRLETVDFYSTEFALKSNTSNPDEKSAIVIKIPSVFKDADIVELADRIVYFPINPENFHKTYEMAREKMRIKIAWKHYREKSTHFFSFLKKSSKKYPLGVSSYEKLIALPDKDLNSFFEAFWNQGPFESPTDTDVISQQLEYLKSLPVSLDKALVNSSLNNQNLAYSKWAILFLAKFFREMKDTMKSSAHLTEKLKKRTVYISSLFNEFNLLKEQRFAMTSVILRHKFGNNNKSYAINLCIMIEEYLGELEGYLKHPQEEEEVEVKTQEEKTQNIIDESSYLYAEFFENSDYLNCHRLIEIIIQILSNEQLNVELIESYEFYSLCSHLISHKSVFFNIQGIYLLFQAFNYNSQNNYSLKLTQFEQNSPFSTKISRLLLNAVYKLSQPFLTMDSSSTILRSYALLLENYRIFEISALFEGSFYHCSTVTTKDIEFLFECIHFFFEKMQEFESTTKILGLISVFLRFCDSEIIENIMTFRQVLLSVANQCVGFFIFNKDFENNFKIVVELLNTLFFALSKKEFYIEKTLICKKDSERDLEKMEIFMDPTVLKTQNKTIDKKSFKKNKKEPEKKKKKKEMKKEMEKEKLRIKNEKIDESDLKKGLEMALCLRKQGEEFLTYEKIDQEKLKLIIEQEKALNLDLTTEKLALQSALDKEKQNFESLMHSSRTLEFEKFELKQKISNLMLDLDEKGRAIARMQASSKEKEESNQESQPTFDEDHDEFLLVNSPDMISETQARSFIENLQRTRKNMKDLRSSICGALKFLGNDLYSSQTHFFYEIIQNAEDNQYLTNQALPPFLYFVLTEEFILVLNNERGFVPKNVAAICQIGQSSKAGGYSIGQKGLGFKSVFSCSNNPQIYSSPWRFAFKVEEGLDELQYITPSWIDQLPKEIEQLFSKYECQTKIFLPFKSGISKERRKEMNGEISANLDPNILLNLTNLKEIRVINDENNRSIEIVKQTISEEYLGDYKYNSSSFRNLIRREIVVKKSINSTEKTCSTSFLCYTCELEIPIAIINEEKSFKSNSLTRILLAFPLDMREKKTFPLYAFLPLIKENHGFKFIINCDWVLTTNRESIRENEWNAFVRNNLAQFLVHLMFQDSHIKTHFAEFLPRDVKSLWWKSFAHDISEELNKKENIIKMFNFGGEKEVLLSNEVIKTLISFEEIQEILKNVFILDRKSINAEIFEKSCKVLSIEQVIDCLENPNFACKKSENNKNQKWWKDFFKIVLEELSGTKASVIREKLKKSNIFLWDQTGRRSKLPILREKTSITHVFICKDEKLREKNWRKEIILLTYDSDHEFKVLSKLLMISEITTEKLLKIIYSSHLNYDETTEISEETIWNDLAFIKAHFKEFIQLFPEQILGLLVPTIYFQETKENFKISRVVHSVFPFILGVAIDHKDLLEASFIIKIFWVPDNDETVLSWELFFLEIGSRVPSLAKPYQFHNFVDLSNDFVENALKILELQGSLIYQAQKMCVLCTDGEEYPLKEVFDVNLINDEFPCLEIPQNCRKLAEKLGVTVKSSFQLSLKILDNLSKRKENSIEKFQKWLYHLNSSLSEKNIEDFMQNNWKSISFLYFPKEFKPYISIDDLFITEEKDQEKLEFLSLICEKNKKVLISVTKNVDYVSFQFLFKKLGAKSKVDFDFLNTFMEELLREDDIYYEKGNKMSLLSEKGLKLLNKSFEFYESLLEKEMNIKKPEEASKNIDWKFREDLYEEVKEFLYSLKITCKLSLPFITHRKTLLPNLSLISKHKFACLNPEIVNEITSESQDFVFFEPSFALNYPLVIAFLNIEYLELFSIITFCLNAKNPMRHLPTLSQNIIDRYLTESESNSEFKFVKAIYPSLFLKISPKSMNYEKGKAKFKIITRSPFIFTPSMIYICDPEVNRLNKILAQKAISEYMSRIVNKTVNEKEIIHMIESSIETVSLPTIEKEMNFEMKNMFFISQECEIPAEFAEIFSEKPKLEQQALHDFFIQKFTGNDNYNTGNIHSAQVSNIVSEAANQGVGVTGINVSSSSNMVKQILLKITSPAFEPLKKTAESQQLESRSLIVNENEIREIGQNAEHFFFAYLGQIFPDHCIPKNWVSSKRLRVFGEVENINDAAGYDFEILDVSQIIKPYYQKKPIKLLFEVKGFKDQWNGSFIMSQNEINRAEESIHDPFESYYIVIVELVGSGEIRFAHFFEWKESREFLKFVSESSRVEWDNEKYEELQKRKVFQAPKNFDPYPKKDEERKREQNNQSKVCFYSYRCLQGFNCSYYHPSKEKIFFRENRKNGSNYVDLGKVKVERCKINHKNEKERDTCRFAHDESDSFCLDCNNWTDHVRDECPYSYRKKH